MNRNLRIIFAGTPDFAAQHLAVLIKSQHTVVAAYCPPDKPSGRGKKLSACATKLLALSHDITVEQPTNFKLLSDQEKLASYHADIMIVVAYGLLLPKVILKTPLLGCINVHGSLLPQWRGAAPIQRSLEAGDQKTGVTIMQMDEGLDTGDMILTAECDIELTDTSADLYEKLAQIGPSALIATLDLMAQENYQAQSHQKKQDNSLATYAHKLDKTEAELNWRLTASVLQRKVRAYNPWPVSQFTLIESASKQHRIRVLKASVLSLVHNKIPGTIISADKNGIVVATDKDALCIEIIQLPGKKPLPVKDIINGRRAWFTAGNNINSLLNEPLINNERG